MPLKEDVCKAPDEPVNREIWELHKLTNWKFPLRVYEIHYF